MLWSVPLDNDGTLSRCSTNITGDLPDRAFFFAFFSPALPSVVKMTSNDEEKHTQSTTAVGALDLNHKQYALFKHHVQQPVAPVAQRYHVTSDTLGREFDPGKRDFSH